jgi:hypothetical protein
VDDHRHQLVEVGRDQLAQPLRPVEVAHAHAAARDLRLVRRPDAALGRADRVALLLAAPLAQPFDEAMVRQDHVRAFADEELAVLQEPLRLTVADLLEEGLGVDDHAVAEDAALAGVEHARRDQVRDQLLAADDERVPGVGTAAVAHDRVGALGEDVDDLALSFVAPLGSDHDDD